MTEENEKALQLQLCELFQDIYDCLRSMDDFDDLYFLREDTEKKKVYQIKEKYVDDPTYIYRITVYSDTHFQFTIPEAAGNMKFSVDVEEEKADQIFESFFTGDTLTFDKGLRMDENDVLMLEDVVQWCEKHNPDYW